MLRTWCWFVLMGLCVGMPETSVFAATRGKVEKIIVHGELNPQTSMTIDVKGKNEVTKILDLGDEWSGILELIGLSQEDKVRVFVTVETSMCILDEGPHVDLLDWKHYRSQSTELLREKPATTGTTSSAPHRYAFSRSVFLEHAFPFTSKTEFLSKVRAATKNSEKAKIWNDLAKKCEAPQSYPCSVSVSTVWLKVFPGESYQGKPLVDVVLHVPMGD